MIGSQFLVYPSVCDPKFNQPEAKTTMLNKRPDHFSQHVSQQVTVISKILLVTVSYWIALGFENVREAPRR